MILKPLLDKESEITSRAQMPSERGRNHSENLTFSASLREQM